MLADGVEEGESVRVGVRGGVTVAVGDSERDDVTDVDVVVERDGDSDFVWVRGGVIVAVALVEDVGVRVAEGDTDGVFVFGGVIVDDTDVVVDAEGVGVNVVDADFVSVTVRVRGGVIDAVSEPVPGLMLTEVVPESLRDVVCDTVGVFGGVRDGVRVMDEVIDTVGDSEIVRVCVFGGVIVAVREGL
jgi:hypothetical protein